MAGITDLPFRNICRNLGAGLATSEMLTSDSKFWSSTKSRTRLPSNSENGLKSIQIVGTNAKEITKAAIQAEILGADIIDINMGCPAKKVCNKYAGSALMQKPDLIDEITEKISTK